MSMRLRTGMEKLFFFLIRIFFFLMSSASSASSLSPSQQQQLLDHLHSDGIQFIRVELCGHYGRSQGKLIPVSQAASFLKNGIALPAFFAMTLHGNVYPPLFPYPNMRCLAYPDTYCVLPFITSARVARIMCYPHPAEKVHQLNPRSVCLAQLQRMKVIMDLWSE